MKKPLFYWGKKCSSYGACAAALLLSGVVSLKAQSNEQAATKARPYQPPTLTMVSETQKAGKTPATSKSYSPPTVHANSGRFVSKPTSSPAPSSPAGRLHTVREGETLWRVAAKYNTSVNELRLANRLKGNTVAVGQVLIIPTEGSTHTTQAISATTSGSPSSNVHVVKKGQTFENIAKMYKVSPDVLARANPSTYPDRLLIGEKLVIPGRKASSATGDAHSSGRNSPPNKKFVSNNISSSSSSRTHTVRPGQTLSSIARIYGISPPRLIAVNKLKNPDLLEVGRVLTIPDSGPSAPTPSNAAVASQQPEASPSLTKPATVAKVQEHTANVPSPTHTHTEIAPPTKASVTTTPASAPAPDSAVNQVAVSSLSPVPSQAQASIPATITPTVNSHRRVLAYRLERGDTIESVANMFGTTPEKIREMNKLGADAIVGPGDELVVPAKGPVSIN